MATRKNQEEPSPAHDAGTFEKLGRKLDQRPELASAEEAVRLAREQLERAQRLCDDLRRQTAVEIEKFRQQNVGDLVEGTLRLVRKHPGPGVCLAAAIGFFLGRLFRR